MAECDFFNNKNETRQGDLNFNGVGSGFSRICHAPPVAFRRAAVIPNRGLASVQKRNHPPSDPVAVPLVLIPKNAYERTLLEWNRYYAVHR
jgi:hypothetical protein